MPISNAIIMRLLGLKIAISVHQFKLTGAFVVRARPILDSEQTIVFCHSIRSAERSRLNLPCRRRNSQVGNRGVFRLTRTMRNHHA